MNSTNFSDFFTGEALALLLSTLRTSLQEDGCDLTTNAVFAPDAPLSAAIIAKEENLVAGLAILPLVLEETTLVEPGFWQIHHTTAEGTRVGRGSEVASFSGSARVLLRAERIILNFLCHLSGIANLVHTYTSQLEGTGVRLLDTRKTLPGLRYPEKYAVLVGGGTNHRKNLREMLMLKDNHIDAAGGITPAVEALRASCRGIPIEVECRTVADVREAAALGVERIMLDNMDDAATRQALVLVPPSIEVEISGNVTLETIRQRVFADCPRKPDFISVGRLTHSAPYADFSMYIS